MRVGFIGIGNLGRDAAEVMAQHYDVVGFDIRQEIDTTVNMTKTLAEAVQTKDIVFVAVPTPHHKDYDGRYPTSHLEPRDFDYTAVKTVISSIDKLVDEKTLIVLISTVLPGTVRREIAPLVKKGRFIYNPYLIAQGSVKFDMIYPEMIIIGTEDGGESIDAKLLKWFYNKFVFKRTRIVTGTWEEAEGIKIFYNTFISTKLALVNMIADVSESIGNMNVDVITTALKESTKRIMGSQYMSAGLGDGGGCHPRDNIALRYLAKELDLGYDLFEAIMTTREKQAKKMAEKIISFNQDVCILGRGFKPGVDQEAGSPAILLGSFIEHRAFNIYWDVHPDEVTYPLTYVMHHHEKYSAYDFNPGSIIFDPFGKTYHTEELTNKGISVYNYGRGST